jgi:uncharacterized protein GlcG (DUF336 family)
MESLRSARTSLSRCPTASVLLLENIMLTIARAKTLVEAARNCATDHRMKPLAVVVLDAGGHLVCAEREDGATMLRYDIARAKAWTSLGLGSNSRAYQELADARPHFAASLNAISDGRMAAAAGGYLIKDGDVVIGAIGVSGDTPGRVLTASFSPDRGKDSLERMAA